MPFRTYYLTIKMLISFQKEHEIAGMILPPLALIPTIALVPLFLEEWIPYEFSFYMLLTVFLPHLLIYATHGIDIFRR